MLHDDIDIRIKKLNESLARLNQNLKDINTQMEKMFGKPKPKKPDLKVIK